jgi:DNA-binding PadR family transcriptional regulator
MAKDSAKAAAPTSVGDSFTSVEYWNGLIKMSLSKFFILCVLQQRSLHGYEVAKEVAVMTRGCCSPTEGTIYPVLREFEAGGLVTFHTETVSGRGRKIYTITDKGRRAFKVASDAWMEATACVIESRKNLQL